MDKRFFRMKRIWIGLVCMIFPLGVMAQQRAEYNRKGDEAMERLDYSDARMWYEEGVAVCDSYSINQLTEIWLSNDQMRPSMRSLMNKCLNCLTVKATEDDPEAISQLIIYYTEGIGTPKSEELASYWEQYQESQEKQVELNVFQPADEVTVFTDRRMRFFAGYAYSIESPYGITIGGIAKRFGWYVRFKTNMSFDSYEEECNDEGDIINFTRSSDESYEPSASESSKTNSLAGTAGLIVKCCPWLYASVGLGYGERTLLHPFTTHSYADYSSTRELWCKNVDSSYSGVTVELDFMVKLTSSIYVSAGCNTIKFEYVDLNAGLGVFF